jgi:replicative DNA helicase
MEDINNNAKRRVRNNPINQVMEMGKLPPQAIDLEEAVLGAMLLEKDAVNDVIDILQPESFYREAHQKIFASIMDLFKRSEPVDIVMVTSELRKRGELDFVGGPFYVSQLTNRVASSANAEFHARIIAQKYIQRELIKVSNEVIKKAYDESTDVFELLDEAEKGLYKISEGNIRKDFEKMKNLIHLAIKQIESAKNKPDGISGVPSGFTELDRVTSGWQPSDLIILAARPGMGKTAFVLSMARNTAVEYGKPVAVFSLEMSALQLVHRLIASETELEADKLRKGSLADHEWEQLNAKIKNLAEAPLFIDDTPALSIFELRAKCRRLKAEHDIQLIIVDYLQLMTTGGEIRGGNVVQEISTISRALKVLAKELNVPVIALSQLSRDVEKRGGDKRPQLSDLRDSGAIEQDADIVTFIYRPEYYGFTQNPETGANQQGMAEIIVAKHRNGALKNVPLRFIDKLAKFVDMETDNFDPFGGMAPSDDFDTMNPGSFTIMPSKMNDDDEAPF